jgi:WD40 repeat protein
LESPPQAQFASTAAPSSSNSAVLPGGTSLSAIETSRRRQPFFRSVAQIGRRVAQGLAYAHARGIVHRDIKPSNLLLDIAGIFWITDFGLAKAADDGLTATGDLLGTLRYMAPERFRGQGDARADIYALGLTLYELLTLRPAFDSADRLKLIDRIQTEEPGRPRSLDSRIPRDLETIVLKAIDKEPGRRYPSADALAEDLRRFLDDEPILARPATAVERLLKLARRRPAVAALNAALVAVAVVGLTGIIWQWRQAVDNLAQANKQREYAVNERENALKNLVLANQQRAIAQQKSREASEKTDSLERQLYINHIQLAQNEWSTNSSSSVLDTLTRCLPELRNWERSYLNRLCHLERLAIEGGRSGLAFSPDGSRVASADRTHRVKVWDTRRGDLVLTRAGHTNTVYALAFSPDGRLLASGSVDTTIRLWDAATGALVRTLEPGGSWIRSVAFSPDGTRLVSGSGAELFTPAKTAELILWDVASGREIRRFAGPHDRIYGVAYRPDGKRIASINCESSLKLWDPETGALEHRLTGHTYYINCVAYSPDGRSLATGGRDHVAILWDVAGAKILHTLRGHDSVIGSLDFSPNSKFLIAADWEAGIKLWDVSRGAEIAHLRNSGGVTDVRYCPDGRNIATVGYDHTLKLWEPATLESVEHRVLGGHRGWCYRAGYTPDGRIVVTTGWGLVRLWNAATGRHVRDVETGFASGVYGFAIRSDGRVIATAQERGPKHVDLWDVATGRRLHRLAGHTATVKCVAFSPVGMTLASAGEDFNIRLWDSSDGRAVATLAGHTSAVEALAFSPDGELLASQGLENFIRIWDVATGLVIRVHDDVPREQSSNYGASLTFSPDGTRLAAARSDGLVSLWDMASGAKLTTLSGHRGPVNSVAFLGRGRIVTTSDDRTVKLWDLASGANVLTLRGHSGAVLGLACRPDGSQLATTGMDEARIWDAAGAGAPARPNAPIAIDRTAPAIASVAPPANSGLWSKTVLTGHTATINRIAYAPDGKTLATASDDMTIRLWEAATGQARAVLSGHHGPVNSLAFAPDGRTLATGEGYWRKSWEPAELKLWDVSSGSCIASWEAHGGPIWSLAFSPDGLALASGASDGLVKLWHTASHSERATLNVGTGEWVRGLAFTPDGNTLASSHMAVARLWDLAKREVITSLRGHSREITAMAMSSNGEILATASRDETAILWDWKRARQLATVRGNEGCVNDVAFSRDGKTLAIGVMDGSVKLWDVAAGRIKAVGQVRNGCSLGVSFSPDGKTVASSHNPFGILSRVAE